MFTDEVPVEEGDRTCDPSGKSMGAWGSSDGILRDDLAFARWKLPCYLK